MGTAEESMSHLMFEQYQQIEKVAVYCVMYLISFF